jgi:hypothetical protein
MLRATGSPKLSRQEEPKPEVKPAVPIATSTPTSSSLPVTPAPATPTTPLTPIEGESMTDRAERLRQQYLQKKAAGTLDRRKASPSPNNPASPITSRSAVPPPPPVRKNDNQDTEKENTPKTRPEKCSPRPAVKNSVNNNTNGGPPSGIADLASVIAQRAMSRQKSYESTVDTNGNTTNKTSYSTVYKGPIANGTPNGGTKLSGMEPNSDALQARLGGNGRVQIPVRGATTDATNTETAPNTPAHGAISPTSPSQKSVFDKARIFESQGGGSRQGSMSPKVPSKSKSSSPELPFELPPPMMYSNGLDDNPPPMVAPPPPPDFDYNARPTDLDIINGHNSRGHETVGWVINSSPSRTAHDVAIRNKISRHNGGPVGMHYNGGPGDVGQMALISPSHMVEFEDSIQVDFIPPPPVFDCEDADLLSSLPRGLDGGHKLGQEDNTSMVSSLSTLSTLSSSEQDNYHHDSSGYSSGRNRGYGSSQPSTSSQQSDEAYSEMVAPPPPGFDDMMEGEPHYEDLETVHAFIPPPMGFDLPPPMGFDSPPHEVPPVRHRSRREFEHKPMDEWSVEDVADWLEFLQLTEHRQIFLRNNVNGRILSQLGRNELIAMGVTQVGHRMSLERAIKRAQLNM